MSKQFKVTIVNDISEVTTVLDLFEEFGEDNRLDPGSVYKVNLALDELITNVITHGYTDDKEHFIEIEFSLSGDRLLVQISDDGQAYDPRNAPVPDLSLDVDGKPIGGLGVHLVKKMMDSFDYERVRGKNVVRLSKKVF